MVDEKEKKTLPAHAGGVRLTGLAARKAAALANKENITIGPEEMEHRLGIIFDNSGSMRSEQIADAHAGIEEFLKSCEPNKTAVSVYPLNAEPLALSMNLPALALLVKRIHATGGTPLVSKLNEMLENHPFTRAIVFSDGMPNGYHENDYEKILDYKIPVDTVFITLGGEGRYRDEEAERFMQKLAKDTGGIYLKFDRTKSNFRTAFKYLSPGLRYLLADKSFVDKLQGN